MRYILVTLDALIEIASERRLQSPEFAESAALSSVLQGQTDSWRFGDLRLVQGKEGMYICTSKPNIKQGLVFDLNSFKGFSNYRNDKIITIFQKVIKFSIKIFENIALSSSERYISGTNLAICFPFPFSVSDPYRVVIDRYPEAERMAVRGNRYLLVFDDGTSNKSNIPSYATFNKSIEHIGEFCKPIALEQPQLDKINTVTVTNLSTSSKSYISDIGIENWEHFLTEPQKKFINKPINGCERLEGAAGTGKTLTMILRCIYKLKKSFDNGEPQKILFITHSLSSKNQIIDTFRSNYPDIDIFLTREPQNISINVTTLQEWCIDFLGTGLGESEYLYRDARDSKELQLMYIQNAFDEVMTKEYDTYKPILSESLTNYFDITPQFDIMEMLQHEIAVSIKGIAGEDINKYQQIKRPAYSIPCENENDRSFLFLIYEYYKKSLVLVGQFDSDDIILSVMGQVNTPIWRRRKIKEGYDVCFIDETHLFNVNELSIFHYLLNGENNQNIIYTIDKSQAVGDRGLSDETLTLSFGNNQSDNEHIRFATVFRSSPDIVNLAFSVLSSGASIFTNFENPLDKVNYSFTSSEEKKCKEPVYFLLETDDKIIEEAFTLADQLVKELLSTRSKILIVTTSPYLLNSLKNYAKKYNKPFEVIEKRGDIEVVKSAEKSNRYVISHIDFVGGLEFDAVIIAGVDKSRVPPTMSEEHYESYHFLNYAWHNRMYVAITRAKYAVYMLGEKSRRPSRLLESAINSNLIKLEE